MDKAERAVHVSNRFASLKRHDLHGLTVQTKMKVVTVLASVVRSALALHGLGAVYHLADACKAWQWMFVGGGHNAGRTLMDIDVNVGILVRAFTWVR